MSIFLQFHLGAVQKGKTTGILPGKAEVPSPFEFLDSYHPTVGLNSPDRPRLFPILQPNSIVIHTFGSPWLSLAQPILV